MSNQADSSEFWEFLDRLIESSSIVMDRPKGSRHPRYPDLVYPLDYGYLEGTTTIDGSGIDLWLGSRPDRRLDAVVLTVDVEKRDAEIKLLIGCSDEEQQVVLAFLHSGWMRALLVRRP